MKKILIVVLLTINLISVAQVIPSKKNLIGYWQSQDVPTRFYVFSINQAIRFSIYSENEIIESYYTYGFCDELKLKSINDLKNEGYYYFEVEDRNFQEKYKEKDGTYRGIQANIIQMEDDKNSFQIYDSARPGQRGTYKRISKLPLKLAEVLKSKGIEISNSSESKKMVIRVSKSTLYKSPRYRTNPFVW